MPAHGVCSTLKGEKQVSDAQKKYFYFSIAIGSLFLFATFAGATGGPAGVVVYLVVIGVVGGLFGVVLTCFGLHALLAFSLGALIGFSGIMFGLLLEDRFPIFDLREKPPSSNSSIKARPTDLKMKVS